jgi:CRISPR/Cas system-associated exonuclease Cas4 (RecB family)
MKKMILTLAIAVSSLASFAGSSFGMSKAFKGEENVNKQVLNAFKTEFNTVKDVEWTAGTDFYKASFVYNEKHVFAYYNIDGDLLGLTRYISSVDLPLNLQIGLKKNGKGYWISDLFEVAKNEVTSYYITLENADTKMVLWSVGGSNWEEFKTVKKS